MVEEATEPSLADEEVVHRIAHLVTLCNANLSCFAIGGEVALALQERLKSHAPTDVMNALLLLDELEDVASAVTIHSAELQAMRA